MSDRILSAEVIGGDAVARKFKERASRLRERMRETMDSLGEQLLAGAVAAAPLGDERQVGHRNRKGGQLKKSARLKVFDQALTIGARVMFKKYYARWVETGYGPAEERVRGYVRRDPRSTLFKTKVSGALSKRKLAQGIVFVRPFNRTGKASAHAFLVPTAQGMRGAVRSRLEAVVDATMKMED